MNSSELLDNTDNHQIYQKQEWHEIKLDSNSDTNSSFTNYSMITNYSDNDREYNCGQIVKKILNCLFPCL